MHTSAAQTQPSAVTKLKTMERNAISLDLSVLFWLFQLRKDGGGGLIPFDPLHIQS